ncbi:MAG: hypothetical protein FWD58_05940 [Firmicutes bacterium]|nr:hypothetical protein [Bacillota bacterium]
MSPFWKNALKSAAALGAVTLLSVLMLAFSNAFLPKYTPKLDAETAAILNEMSQTAPEGETDLLGFFEPAMKAAELEAWNKANGSPTRKVLAAYTAVKGTATGTLFVETETAGYLSDVRLIIAVDKDGFLLKDKPVYIRDMPAANDWYSGKIDGIGSINEYLSQADVSVSLVNDLNLKKRVTADAYLKGRAGATITTNAFAYAIELAAAFYKEVAG